MATVTNWIDHLNKPAEEVAGAIYPGAGSSEGLLVILAIILWVGWHVLTAKSESDELNRLGRDDSIQRNSQLRDAYYGKFDPL